MTPLEVSAEILRVLRARAEEALAGPLAGAVITVPAYFDDGQRQATRDAGRLAGLEVLRLLNEPTAAALAYGLDKQAEGTFAVFDLGGGTFDVSILKLENGVFEVKSTGGDSALGGDDFDRAIAEALLTRAGAAGATDPHVVRRVLDAARALKERLTTETEAAVDVALSAGKTDDAAPDARGDGGAGGARAPALRGRRCAQALTDADVEPGKLSGVILVGGATRMPLVRRFVEQTVRAAAARRHRSRSGRRAGRRHPGRHARGRRRPRRRAAAGRRAAVAGAGDDGRRRREADSPQHDGAVRRQADVHDLRRQADRIRPARRAG